MSTLNTDIEEYVSKYCHCCAGMGCETHANRPKAKAQLQNLITKAKIQLLEELQAFQMISPGCRGCKYNKAWPDERIAELETDLSTHTKGDK